MVLAATHSAGFRGSSDPFDVRFSPSAPVFTGCTVSAPGQFQLQATGTAGLTYTVQASTNLVNWMNYTNVTADLDGRLIWAEEMHGDAPARFYRLRWP
jgi:hypothetical protein